MTNAKQIKTLNDTKTNIQNTINKIAADNQISLKTAKDKGDKTKKFTYIIRKLIISVLKSISFTFHPIPAFLSFEGIHSIIPPS